MKPNTKAILSIMALFTIFIPAWAQITAGRQTKLSASSTIKRHPAIGRYRECSDCHKQEFHEWDAGRHGVNLVKCSVCHGAIESNFTPRPTAKQCVGCHGQAVGELETNRFMKGKTCFTCHTPHELRPHAKATVEGSN